MVYYDDCIIYSRTKCDNFVICIKFLKCLENILCVYKHKKCQFFQSYFLYLTFYVVSNEQILSVTKTIEPVVMLYMQPLYLSLYKEVLHLFGQKQVRQALDISEIHLKSNTHLLTKLTLFASM